MIPAITPPTDNLYKFLSLFGLTIFLFAIYNLGFVFDQSSQSKMKIEEVKVDVQKKIYELTQTTDKSLETAITYKRFRPSKISLLGQDLQKIQKAIFRTKLNAISKIELVGEISKLQVGVDTLKLKFWTYGIIIFIGLFIMVFGFLRWNKREQKLRDKILFYEHDLKRREQEAIDETFQKIESVRFRKIRGKLQS